MRRMYCVLAVCLAVAAVGSTTPVAPARAATRLPWCGPGVLWVSIGGQTGGAGSIFTTLVLRNVGRVTCTLRGYPGVSLVDRRGRQIGRAAVRVNAPISWIVLRPGGAASTAIRTLNPGVGTSNCLPPSTYIRIYTPDAYTSVLIRARLSECLGALEVRPLVAGSAVI